MAAKPEESGVEKKPINRREFLNFAWLASLGFLTVSMGGMTYFVRHAALQGGGVWWRHPGWVGRRICQRRMPRLTNYPKVKFWISNTDQGVLAIYKVCTHLGCLYNWNDQEDKFICPCHGSEFEKDGIYITGPAPRSLDRFVVQAVDPETGEILAEASDGQPMPVPDNPNAIIQVDTGQRVRGEPHA